MAFKHEISTVCVFFKEFLQLFICLPTQCPHGQGEGVATEKADRCGQEWEGVEN